MERSYKDPLPLNWDCPSGLVVRTPYSQGRGHGFSPWLGKIPYAQWPGQKKKKKKIPTGSQIADQDCVGPKAVTPSGTQKGSCNEML